MISRAKEILQIEARAISELELDNSFEDAVKLIVSCNGKVLTTGIGKAGYIARKAASTFSTTGSPSVFVHPGDSSHGDIGVVEQNDIVIAYSNSGKTREVLEFVDHAKKLNISKIISISSTSDSPLAKESDIVIETGKQAEACPFNYTPTTSTAVMMAISDALAICSMEESGFKREDFALRHHGGYLGVRSRNDTK